MVEVRYKNTEKQWVDFSMYKMNTANNKDRLSLLRRNLFLGIGLFIFVLYCVLGIQEYNNGENPIFSIISGLIFLIIGIVGYFKLPLYWNNRAKKNFKELFKKNEKILGRTIEVLLDKEALTITRNKEKTKVSLNDIVNVEETNECMYVIFKDNQGIVIPNDTFKNDEEKQRFKTSTINFVK